MGKITPKGFFQKMEKEEAEAEDSLDGIDNTFIESEQGKYFSWRNCGLKINPFSAWYPLKGHAYSNNSVAKSFRFV